MFCNKKRCLKEMLSGIRLINCALQAASLGRALHGWWLALSLISHPEDAQGIQKSLTHRCLHYVLSALGSLTGWYGWQGYCVTCCPASHTVKTFMCFIDLLKTEQMLRQLKLRMCDMLLFESLQFTQHSTDSKFTSTVCS